MLRSSLPASCFITSAPLLFRPRPSHLSIQRHPRALRCATRTIYASAEEELFIRRHSRPGANKPPTQIAPQKQDDPEEHFDFVHGDEKTPAPIASPQSASLHGENAPVTEHPRTNEGVRVAAPPGLRGFHVGTKRVLLRLMTESELINKLRIPTSRETVIFAWEVVLILALLVLLRAGVSSTLRCIHNRLNTTRGLKSNIPYEDSVFECMQRPLEFLSLFTVGTALAEVVSRPLAATGLLRHILTMRELGIIVSATWFLLRWIERIRSRFSVAKSIDKAQVDATSRIATVVTFGASVLISLDTIGINVQTVLAFGGIGGVAIGFAGREIISNFFGGFMIYVTRPFSVGEWIRSIEEEELNGTVEDIGWYLTRVRTWDKRPLYIPNSRFSTLIVENGSRMDNRRIVHTLHVRHEDMPVVPSIVAAMESLLMSHQELDPRQHRLAYVDSFGEYSVKIWFSCYTKSVFLYDFRRVQQDVLIKCYEIIRKNGARLATVNTRDVRSGVDTDRYGALGKGVTHGQGAHRVQTHERAASPDGVYGDVPLKRPNANSNPVVGYTIESGVDLSAQSQHLVPNGVPSNSGVASNRRSDNGDADEFNKVGTNRESGPPMSTSEAAVMAAAAALAAARRNASRVEGSGTPSSQASARTRNDIVDGKASNAEKANVSPQPPGEMRISAAKPPRSSTTPSGASTGAAQASGGMKQGDKMSNENANAHSAQTHGGAEEGGGNGAPKSGMQSVVGEMKISKARKPMSVEATRADNERNGDVSKSASREGHGPPNNNDGKGAGRAIGSGAGQERKFGAGKGNRATSSGGNGTGAGSAGLRTGSENGPHVVNGTSGNGSGAGHHKGNSGRDEGGGTAKSGGIGGRQAPGSNGGEMKISKARKPKSVGPVETGGEDVGGSGIGSKNEDDGKGEKGRGGDSDGGR